MTEEQYEIYKRAAELGTIPDEFNPVFLFSATHVQLLVRILGGELDPVEMVRREMRNRGLDDLGNWIGSAKADQKKPVLKPKRAVTRRKGKGL